MQLLSFAYNHSTEILAVLGGFAGAVGALGTLLTKFSNSPSVVKFGHRLEAIGFDGRKLLSGKSRTTDSK